MAPERVRKRFSPRSQPPDENRASSFPATPGSTPTLSRAGESARAAKCRDSPAESRRRRKRPGSEAKALAATVPSTPSRACPFAILAAFSMPAAFMIMAGCGVFASVWPDPALPPSCPARERRRPRPSVAIRASGGKAGDATSPCFSRARRLPAADVAVFLPAPGSAPVAGAINDARPALLAKAGTEASGAACGCLSGPPAGGRAGGADASLSPPPARERRWAKACPSSCPPGAREAASPFLLAG